MSQTTITIPTYPALKKEAVPVKQLTAVERSLARPDAFSKPGTMGQQKTRIRTLRTKPKSGHQRKKKRDPRQVKFY
jgi:hypothetical protein